MSLLAFDAIQAATVQIKRECFGGSQKWTLTGSAEAVQCKVDSLLREYPKGGYGTLVEKRGDATVVTTYSAD